jgi:chromosome segregation ATPase
MASLESAVQAQSSKIQKLRGEKGQLQSLLDLEKAAISKLEFENNSLQTMLEGLKTQVASFQEHVDACTVWAL